MKHLILFISLLFVAGNASAQLTLANNAPVLGESHQRYQCDSTGINPGASGANAVWNFAMATHSSLVHSYTVVSASIYSQADVQQYSDKGYSEDYKAGTYLFSYSSEFHILGSYFQLNYDDNAPTMKARYPMSLNTTATFNTSGGINLIYGSFPVGGNFTGKATTLADATGTLVLPDITYTNVLRVVNTETLTCTGMSTSSYNGTLALKSYEYFAPGAKPPVFSIITARYTRPLGTITQTLVMRLKHVVPAAPVDITPNEGKLVCENTSATLTASGDGTIEWFDSENASTAVGSGSVYVVPLLPAGVYTMYAQANNFLLSSRTAISFTVDACTSLDAVTNQDQFKIFPNPASGIFNVVVPAHITSMEIYNNSGERVYVSDTSAGIRCIDLRAEPDGIYFIRLFENGVPKNSYKIFKQSDSR